MVPQLLLTCSLAHLLYSSISPLQSQLGLRPVPPSTIQALSGYLGWRMSPCPWVTRHRHAAAPTPTLHPTIPSATTTKLSGPSWGNWALAPGQLWGQWKQQMGKRSHLRFAAKAWSVWNHSLTRVSSLICWAKKLYRLLGPKTISIFNPHWIVEKIIYYA